MPVLKFLGDALERDATIAAGCVFVEGKPVPVDAGTRSHGNVKLFVRPWQLGPSRDGQIRGTVRSAYRSQGRAHLSVERDGKGLFTVSSPDGDETVELRIIGRYLF